MPKAGRGSEPIEALLKEGRKFPPPKSFVKAAPVKGATVSEGRTGPAGAGRRCSLSRSADAAR